MLLKNCVRCNAFSNTEKHKSVHNFSKHYNEGKSIPFEDKPIHIMSFPGLTIYSNEFQKHRELYDFYNSEKCVDDFLRNVRYKFKSNGKKWMKSSFTRENIQSYPYQNLQAIINSRYWTTPPYEGIYFNNFIFDGLRQNILCRATINGSS